AHPDARRSKRAETPRSGRRPRGRVNITAPKIVATCQLAWSTTRTSTRCPLFLSLRIPSINDDKVARCVAGYPWVGGKESGPPNLLSSSSVLFCLPLHGRCIRLSQGPRGLGCARSVGQALATEAIAESIRSGGVWEAESNIKLFDFVSTPGATDWDASFTVERINCQENTAKAFRRKCEFDEMREVSFVR